MFGHGSGGTSVFALLASPLSIGLFHRAWIISGHPLLNKTAADASKDNLVFLRNTECLSLNCLINLPAEDILAAIPWDVYPYWDMKEQRDLPTYNFIDGAIAVVDGKCNFGNIEKRFLDTEGAIRSCKSNYHSNTTTRDSYCRVISKTMHLLFVASSQH